ncbi:cobalamin-5'-phosphate synthase [Saccharopolyspora erythraea NRRL 2338]|uniref:Adenosylcobinamide-GDP ribazoletransferase n=2 Tax=Saccharopolyspora erythraea TaxID=1836 RepID=A4FA93_SACEN|nr:adenosylcobinamide-GDP ribazoletransferase [Saccharopolyspora erythraea]EQD86431.1 cobalamin synthase [Saccharopolyspora erythraea D]PFG94754.1 cobalamin-5'-phosphate synthase [Saccharopolyspora erythraea NRRL 2338]QRK91476.1 adenosylcobinamide-GDP ribazoletransferase [Saccharopolyspora erythraea]CAM00968.1 putative cobalamin 5'-phosphate synthase [Saccharopolyspora erythraea NRRL 2338]
MDGLRLAMSWLSVAPVRAGRVDARACRQAIALAPLVGALVGGVAAAVLWVLGALGAPPLLAGLLAVAALVLVTRGMHVDGLADTVDGLGCYGPPERALAVMRDGGAGPFAVVALVLVLGVQAVSLGELAAAGDWATVVVACAAGRAGFALCCRTGVPAARPEGMGALVAGSQPVWAVAVWWLLLLVAAGISHWWTGPVAVAAALAALLVFTHHVRRRFGGITGDVLGAASEIGTTTVLAICAIA